MEGLQLDEDLQMVIDLELRLLQPQVRASAGELETLGPHANSENTRRLLIEATIRL